MQKSLKLGDKYKTPYSQTIYRVYGFFGQSGI